MNINHEYPPLPVLSQGQSPICVLETRANITNAFMRLYKHKATMWKQKDVMWTQADNGCDYSAVTPDGTFTITNGSCMPGWTNPSTREQIKEALLKHGVLETGVPSRARSFVSVWNHGRWRRMPVVVPFAGNDGPAVVDHDVLAIGYTKAGVIILNSWGKEFGKQGCCVLSWEFIAKYQLTFLDYIFNV